VNPNIELNAACAAQQAQAKRDAEAIRKKLLESASKLAADNNADCIVSISAQQEDAEGQSKQKNPREKGQKEDGKPNDIGNHLSDWA